MWTGTVVVLDLLGVGFVFWYLFLHHAKPYQMKGADWGVYGDGNEAAENYSDYRRYDTFICTGVDDPSDLFSDGFDSGDFAA